METIKQGAILADSIIGKPLVVYIDGERREIGTITNATVRGDKLYVGARISLSGEEGEDLQDIMEGNL